MTRSGVGRRRRGHRPVRRPWSRAGQRGRVRPGPSLYSVVPPRRARTSGGGAISTDSERLVDVAIRGKKVDLPDTVLEVAEEKAGRLGRFASDLKRAEVEFSEVGNPRVADRFVCEITVRLKGHFVRSHASAPDLLAALDAALDRIAQQLGRLKEKRVDRSRARRRRPAAATLPAVPDLDEEAAEGEDALVVRTKRFEVKPMPVEEAALQMDLLGHDFYLFTNVENGRAAVLYRRRDGHLGLIEPAG